jgi:hypothetical protein
VRPGLSQPTEFVVFDAHTTKETSHFHCAGKKCGEGTASILEWQPVPTERPGQASGIAQVSETLKECWGWGAASDSPVTLLTSGCLRRSRWR